MLFDNRLRRIAGATTLAGGMLATATAAAFGATHPALTAAALVKIQGVVTCTTTGQTGCVSGTNTSSGAGVLGTSPSGVGVWGTSNKSPGIYGTSVTGEAINGTSSSNDGIVGDSFSNNHSGVVGDSPGYGVFGYTTDNGGLAGVYGVAVANSGVYGTTFGGGGTGVRGYVSANGLGVDGYSQTGTGVRATSQSGVGLFAAAPNLSLLANTSGSSGIGIVARAPSTGWPLVLTDQNGKNVFYVDGVGNINYTGGLIAHARIAGGEQVSAFSPKATLPTVEDTGTGQLVGGAGLVRLDPVFAASIERLSTYRVFITPNGDTRGLFVAEKTENGFIVRESQGGRATVTFDYRIVATALGQAGQRMAVTSAATAPRSPVVPAVQIPSPELPLQAPTLRARQ